MTGGFFVENSYCLVYSMSVISNNIDFDSFLFLVQYQISYKQSHPTVCVKWPLFLLLLLPFIVLPSNSRLPYYLCWFQEDTHSELVGDTRHLVGLQSTNKHQQC